MYHKINDFNEILSGYLAKLARWMLVWTVLVMAVLLYRGEFVLIGALVIGYLAAGVCIWTLVYRTWKSAGLDANRAKQQMLWGMVLRLVTCFVVLAVAAQISRAVFAVTAIGFFLFYGTAMGVLIYDNHRRIIQDENKKG